ncbi:MAG: ATP-binding protein [Eubacteriaceae bacterium]|nr:ATP-binding protein [Eubacteriaceae bacterium]
MERDILFDFIVWKRSKQRKLLVLKGMEGAGKTWALKEFGKRNYASTAYFSFAENQELADFFRLGSPKPDDVLSFARQRHAWPIQPNTTLIIFDDIHLSRFAIQSLIEFALHLPEYHIACTGACLGAIYDLRSIQADVFSLFPMTFLEFLSASGHSMMAEYIMELPKGAEINEAIAANFEAALFEYMAVGGMPEAVKTWLETKSARRLDEKLQEIIDCNENAICLLTETKPDDSAILAIWHSIVHQLWESPNKFAYRANDLQESVSWLLSADLAYQADKISEPLFPAQPSGEQGHYRLYLPDVGMLRRIAGMQADKLIESNARFYRMLAGPLAENYAFCELMHLYKEMPKYWHSSSWDRAVLVIQDWFDLIPIITYTGIAMNQEGANMQSASLDKYIEQYKPGKFFASSLESNEANQVPLYLLWALKKILS